MPKTPHSALSGADRQAARNLARILEDWREGQAKHLGSRPSQADLARQVGITQGAVSQMVRGRTRISTHMALRLAAVLGVHPTEIRPDLPYPAGPPISAAPSPFVSFFRGASPYINAHRGRTFVVTFGGETVAAEGFAALIHDIAQLAALGVRLILVPGCRPQLGKRLTALGLNTGFRGALRITPPEAMVAVREAVGAVRMEIEALLSMGLPNSPMAGARVRVASGNLVVARPVGIRDGIDFKFTGRVRRVDREAIRHMLDNNAIVLVPPMGYSATGETFNLSATEVAAACAKAVAADKLICLTDGPGPVDADGNPVREMDLTGAALHLATARPSEPISAALAACIEALHGGVPRTHLLDRRVDGAVLRELFTRDGIGTLISKGDYETTRNATIEDIGGILELISPLEEAGILVRRSRERLEMEIGDYVVMERDGMIIGCAALHRFAGEELAELACLAVHPAYRGAGRAATLLSHMVRLARREGLSQLFVFTTQTAHWFLENGFTAARLDALPVERQAIYNNQRNAQVYLMSPLMDPLTNLLKTEEKPPHPPESGDIP
ncbi:MAG: amino-acid N-acetyltransferase [Leptospirillia bacterium]